MKKIIIILFTFLFLWSCDNSEFLEESNPNLIASDNFWKDLTDTDAGLTATYSTLLNHYVLSLLEESWRTDMGWPGYGRPTGNRDEGRIYYHKTYTNSESTIQDKWEAIYQGIFRANQVIEALDKLKGTVNETEWKSQMAQARFFRGLFHFYLHTSFNYGSIIIRDAVPRTQADFNKGLAPSNEVIDFFRTDLKYAYDNLPAKYVSGAKNVGRPTAGTAATILGTSFLYEEEYSEALVYFNDVIENPAYGYALVQPEDLFSINAEFNKESIFEIAYNVVHRTELSRWDELSQGTRLATYFGSSYSTMPAWIQYAYKTEPMDSLDNRNYYIDPVKGKTLRNVPLRASKMVTLVEDSQTLYYLTKNVSDGMKKGATGWGFGHCKKYLNDDHLESENDNPQGSWVSGKNAVVNRLADVYLMRAEIRIKNGDITGALKDINIIRKRWGLELLGPKLSAEHTYNNINYTEQSLMDQLMYVEKPLELSNEGHSIRWTDLRRWGVLDSYFEKLANDVYYAVDYTYTKLDGGTGTTDASVVAETPEDYQLKVDFEYDITSQNYRPELHDYLPIPLSEITSNSNIN